MPQFISLNNDDLIAGSDDDYGADFHLSSPPRLEHDMEMAEAAGQEIAATSARSPMDCGRPIRSSTAFSDLCTVYSTPLE